MGTMSNKEKIDQLKQWVDESSNIVFFGGAGVSTESGIPDFRSVDGLYNMKYKFPPEEIISHHFFMGQPEEFWRFYRDKLLIEGVRPNKAHLALARLEEIGKLKAVVTQNIDGLHQAAGSKTVFELHGSVMRNYCMRCQKFFSMQDILSMKETVPRCTCGGRIKPDVVLYEEGLDDYQIRGTVNAISKADMLIIGGTSLVVYPAAGLVHYYKGKKMVLINKSATQLDDAADLLIQDSIGEVLGVFLD